MMCASIGRAQETTIVNHFRGDTTGRGLSGFMLAGSEEHRVIINYYEPAPDKEIDRLSELVGAALNFYIDQSVAIDKGRAKLKKPRKEILRDMNDIVKSAVKYYSYKEIEAFSGFSQEVADKIEEIGKLDFNESEYSDDVTSPASRQRLEFFYFQKHLNELKLMANLEVGNYGNSNLLVYSGSETTLVDEATRDSLLNALMFDPDQTLQPVFTEPDGEVLSLLGMEDQSHLNLADFVGDPAMLSSKIIKMLESNSSQLAGIQTQIDNLREEQMRQWQFQQETRNDLMQSQIDDLRGMVVDLIRMNSGGAITSSGRELVLPSPESAPGVYNIPSTLNIFFRLGSTQLDANSVFALNEVVDILARNQELKIIITGFADKTGTPLQNLMLSQQRAAGVKAFLKKSGLSDDRFITRYLGDSISDGPAEEDRKVQLEFIR